MSSTLHRLQDSDRELAERLWLMFRHDLSEFDGRLPNADGTFRREWVESAFTDPRWAGYIVRLDDQPAGLAFVRALDKPVRVLNTFFIVRGARRGGIGMRAVRELVDLHPGRWAVAFQDKNPVAVRFWRRVAADIAGSDWIEERRPVPGRDDVPPDVWIEFDGSLPAAD